MSGVKLGAVDATVSANLAQKYGVKGYPSIKVFPAGPKSGVRALLKTETIQSVCYPNLSSITLRKRKTITVPVRRMVLSSSL